MHELSIVQEIVKAVEDGMREAGASGPARIVRLTVGRLTAIVPDSMQFYFDMLTRDGGALCGARLEITQTPIVVDCAGCGAKTPVEDINLVCPKCGGVDTNVAGGRELFVESVEVDEDPPDGNDERKN